MALDARLAGNGSGAVPRLASVHVLGFEEVTRRFSVEARDLLRRRLATQFEEICGHRGADVFAVAPGEFAVVSDVLSMVPPLKVTIPAMAIKTSSVFCRCPLVRRS